MGQFYSNFRRAGRERGPFYNGPPMRAIPDILFLAALPLAIFAGLGLGFVLG